MRGSVLAEERRNPGGGGVLGYFLSLARALLDMRSFHSAAAVWGGLSCAAVWRLKVCVVSLFFWIAECFSCFEGLLERAVERRACSCCSARTAAFLLARLCCLSALAQRNSARNSASSAAARALAEPGFGGPRVAVARGSAGQHGQVFQPAPTARGHAPVPAEPLSLPGGGPDPGESSVSVSCLFFVG